MTLPSALPTPRGDRMVPVIDRRGTPVLAKEASQHEILAVLARSLPACRYLEIGVREGCTLWVVCEAGMGHLTRVTLCDTWDNRHGGTNRRSHAHIPPLLRAIGYQGESRYLDGRSQSLIPGELTGEVFDLIHVDGDHDEDAALADLTNCYPLLRLGGAMVVHDTRWPSVARSIERYVDESGTKPSMHTGGKGTAVFWRRA